MKYLPLITILLTIIFNSSCQSTQKASVLPENLYKIKKIKEEKTLYVIYATRNDSTFRVISPKETCSINLNEIKVKGSYPLNLLRLYPNELVERKNNEVKSNPKDSCFISVNKKTHYSLYVANNLSGLCITNNDKDTEEIVNRFGIYLIFCDACKDRDRFLIRLFMK
jgi:hypothetical protein